VTTAKDLADHRDPVPAGRAVGLVGLWFYLVCWVAHLVGRLPPGKDHVPQVGLLLPVRHFFPRPGRRD
jgi:hypothetical protein